MVVLRSLLNIRIFSVISTLFEIPVFPRLMWPLESVQVIVPQQLHFKDSWNLILCMHVFVVIQRLRVISVGKLFLCVATSPPVSCPRNYRDSVYCSLISVFFFFLTDNLKLNEITVLIWVLLPCVTVWKGP